MHLNKRCNSRCAYVQGSTVLKHRVRLQKMYKKKKLIKWAEHIDDVHHGTEVYNHMYTVECSKNSKIVKVLIAS